VGSGVIWLTQAEKDHCECALIRLLAGAPAVSVGWVMGPAVDPQNLPERGTLIVKQNPNNGFYTGDVKKDAHAGIFDRYDPPREIAPNVYGGDRIWIIDQMHLATGGQRGPDNNFYPFIPGKWHIVLTETSLDASHDNDPAPSKAKK